MPEQTPQQMFVDALRDATDRYRNGEISGLETGVAVTLGGAAAFPTPLGLKNDHGPGALSYRDATTDPDEFEALADRVMARHGCGDVGVALVPSKCAVPLVSIDLDGPEQVRALADAARQHKVDPSMWVTVATAGRIPNRHGVKHGPGRHLYVTDVPPGRNSPFGDVVRGDTGHVMIALEWDGDGGPAREHYKVQGRWLASYKTAPWLLPTARSNGGTPPAGAEPLDLDGLPDKLRELLEHTQVADRSAHFHRIVAECKRLGYTPGQTTTAVEPWCQRVGKYVGRVADEVARSWGKVDDEPESPPDDPYEGADPAAGTDTGNVATSKIGVEYVRSQLEGIPEPDWLIDGVLHTPAPVVLVGGYGSGKTFLALSFALSVATGRPWLNRSTLQGRALYIVGEGVSGLHDRIAAWETTWNNGQRVGDDQFTVRMKPHSLARKDTWLELIDYCRDGQYRLVVLDTFSSLAPDADETKDAPLVMRHLSDLAVAIDGTALLVHHPGWSDSSRTRGGYQFEANADDVLLVQATRGSDLMKLEMKKVREGPDGQVLWLRRTPAGSSLVIGETSASAVDVPLRERALLVLTNYNEAGASATARQIADECELTEQNRSNIYRVLGRLVDEGQVVEEEGKPTRYRLAEEAVT